MLEAIETSFNKYLQLSTGYQMLLGPGGSTMKKMIRQNARMETEDQ